MSDAIKNTTKVAIEEESTEGTYVAPQAATSFISPLADGLALTNGKELLERNNLNSSIGKNAPRTGMKEVTGSISVEAKANGTAGEAPEYGLLIESALGANRSSSDAVTTKDSGNTDQELQIEDADIDEFNVGDIILVKESGAYHVSPITAVDDSTGSANITLLVPHPDGNFSNEVVIEKFNTYHTANSGHPTLSVTKYVEDAVREYGTGMRVSNLTLNNFSTGQLADFAFSLQGLKYDKSLNAPSYTPSYDAALPPIVLSACIYVDGTQVPVNDLTFSVENAISFKTSTCSEDGKTSSRLTQRTVSGSFNPYMQDDDISNYTKFENDTQFSLFGYMAIPTGTDGEIQDVVAFYMPKCMISEMAEGDKDGMLQDQLTFQATRGTNGESEEIYITTI